MTGIGTCTGTEELIPAFAFPSSPRPFVPQHHTVPSYFSAQEKYSPAAMLTTLSRPFTGVGCSRSGAFVPSPIWPESFTPQQSTPPPTSSAHVWSRLPATCQTCGTFFTAIGTFVPNFVPSPSSPSALFPQHQG